MGARSKKIYLNISGTNTGRDFGREDIDIDVNVGTSASYSKKLCEIYINSYECNGVIYYDVKIDGQQYRSTTFERKTTNFGKVIGKKINGNPMVHKRKEKKSNDSFLKTISNVMLMGEVLCNNDEEKVKFKKGILKAGMPEGALHMPDDFDQLPIEEQKRRLDGAQEILGEDVDNK